MQQQRTCGHGLAESSAIPATVARLIGSMVDNLELHMKALDRNDDDSNLELDAYASLASQMRNVATQLAAAAKEMEGYRDLAMGKHDERAMADPKVRETFEAFVGIERELKRLLDERMGQHEQLLATMR